MKQQEGYCAWYGDKMSNITEEEQEECDYCGLDCKDCDQYREE